MTSPASSSAEPFPFNLPIWRRSLRLESPDGRQVAEIREATETTMGNPTQGTLSLSSGLRLERCSPSFLWSSDSRWLAVSQYFFRFGLLRRVRVLVVDVEERRVVGSGPHAYYLQPESFADGLLVVTENPSSRSPSRIEWRIPEDLAAQFERRPVDWP